MFYEQIIKQCERKGVKLTPLLKELGMSKGNIEKWRNGTLPSGETLLKLSEYFNVSTDYLLTGNKATMENKKEVSMEELLYNEGITDGEDIKALLRVMEMMKRKNYNAELGNEFISKEFNAN